MSLEELKLFVGRRIFNENILYFSNLQNNLKKLNIILENYNIVSENYDYITKLNLDYLPNSLSKLSITSNIHNGIFNNLPSSLEELVCKNCAVYKIDDLDNLYNNLPRNLKYLTICFYTNFINNNNNNNNNNNKLILTNLPDNLKYIKISNKIKYSLDKQYQEIYFDENFNKIEFV